MAKIKWGMMVVDGRGKLGGHVLSKNKAGAIVRTKVTPANPRTVHQQLVRAILTAVSASWSGLTDAQIEAWQTQAPEWAGTNIFGDNVQPSGKTLFQKLNQNLMLTSQSVITVPPAKGTVPDDILATATIDTTTSSLALTGVDNTAGKVIVLEATPVVSQGTNNVDNRYRQIYHAPADTYVPADAYQAYIDRFGVPQNATDKIFIRVKYVLPNGQASIPSAVRATVTV